MGVEKMVCCGALTNVYADAGNRKHKPGCQWYTAPALSTNPRGVSPEVEGAIQQAMQRVFDKKSARRAG